MNIALPILLFAVAAAVLAVGMLAAGSILGPRRQTAVKRMPYESGMDPIHNARRRFDVRFYLVAIAFLIFDVELLFLYPWAVASRNPEGIDAVLPVADGGRVIQQGLIADRSLVFGGVVVFFLLLTIGLIYDWRKGVFRWR